MNDEDREEHLSRMMDLPGAEHSFAIERETIEEGRSFSSEAVDDLLVLVGLWIGSRIMRRWDETSEPPTVLDVSVTVDVG